MFDNQPLFTQYEGLLYTYLASLCVFSANVIYYHYEYMSGKLNFQAT